MAVVRADHTVLVFLYLYFTFYPFAGFFENLVNNSSKQKYYKNTLLQNSTESYKSTVQVYTKHL